MARLLRMKVWLTLCVAVLVCGSPLLADGYIKAVGSPTGAGLFVDGRYVGPAGRFTVAEKYPLAAGSHKVTLRDPRYDDFTETITVQDGKTTKVRFKLKRAEPAKPPFGRLRIGGGAPGSFLSIVDGDIGAVYVNGRFMGHIDEFNNAGGGLLLNPGTYDVLIESREYGNINQKVTIEANRVTVIPLPGRK